MSRSGARPSYVEGCVVRFHARADSAKGPHCEVWAAITAVMSAILRTMKASLVLLAVLTLACGCASRTTWYAANASSNLGPEAECARSNGIWHVQLSLCEAQGK